jgi:hypothetical protein
MGEDMETAATVAGDALTIVLEGNQVTFRRAGRA